MCLFALPYVSWGTGVPRECAGGPAAQILCVSVIPGEPWHLAVIAGTITIVDNCLPPALSDTSPEICRVREAGRSDIVNGVEMEMTLSACQDSVPRMVRH